MHEENVTEAASVVLARALGSHELFVVQRSRELRFFGDFHAFPGGKVSAGDRDVPVRNGGGLTRDSRRVAAVRELFEETGILLARTSGGHFPRSTAEWTTQREALLKDSLDFGEFLQENSLTLSADDLDEVGSLVTPPFSTLRYDTTFYVAHLPAGQIAEVWRGELERGFWTTSTSLLEQWRREALLISPPTVSMLELTAGRPIQDLPTLMRPVLDQLAAGAIPPIPFAPEVWLIPLLTFGLPPASYTNAYLVGKDPCFLIDPGARSSEEQQRLFELLDAAQSRGHVLAGILLTHHHIDHVEAAAVCSERYSLDVVAHRRTAELLQGKVTVTHFIDEGDRIELGKAPDGRGNWHLDVLHVPGHASGHVVFWEPRNRLLFAGDLVSMLSSVVIAPPDGDLTDYLSSLRRLSALDACMLLPGHGSPTTQPRAVIEKTLRHRAKREQQLLSLLESGPKYVADLQEEIYRKLPAALLRLAELQILAGLQKLEREQRATHLGEGEAAIWQLIEHAV